MNTTPHQKTSQTVTKRTHPPAQGWLHCTFTVHSGERLSTEEAETIVCCFGDPKNYDIALCSQNGKTLKGCVRRKDWKPKDKP